jgi:hypothetical protein
MIYSLSSGAAFLIGAIGVYVEDPWLIALGGLMLGVVIATVLVDLLALAKQRR